MSNFLNTTPAESTDATINANSGSSNPLVTPAAQTLKPIDLSCPETLLSHRTLSAR